MRGLCVLSLALFLALIGGCIDPAPKAPPALQISVLDVDWTCGGPRTAEITFYALNISNRTLTKVVGQAGFKQGPERTWGYQGIASLAPGEHQRFKTIITNEFWCETEDHIQLTATADAENAPAAYVERTIKPPK